MKVAPPIDVARAMVGAGARREAELVLRATVARDAMDGETRRGLTLLLDHGDLPHGPTPRLELALVDAWIRHGMLVEALAVLSGVELDGPASEWANLLGELLAPVPAHAERSFVQMHAELLRGGASVALAILQDREQQGPMPAWATRRLELLRWMLLDNARAVEDDEETDEAPSPLAAALRGPLADRSLERMLEAAEAYAEANPQDADARDAVRMLELLVMESDAGLGDQAFSVQTVPVFGRPAAAMQLRMANLKGAFSIYERLTETQPGDPTVRALHEAVRGIRRVLDGRSPVDRSFPPPPIEEIEAKLGLSPSFAGKTSVKQARQVLEQVRADEEVTKEVHDPTAAFTDDTRALEAPVSSLADPTMLPPGFVDPTAIFTDETRPVAKSELPLDAFADETTSGAHRVRHDTLKHDTSPPKPDPDDAKTLKFDRDAVLADLDMAGEDTTIDLWDTERHDVSEVRKKVIEAGPLDAPSSTSTSTSTSSSSTSTPSAASDVPRPSEVPEEAFDTLKEPPSVIVQRIKGIGGEG